MVTWSKEGPLILLSFQLAGENNAGLVAVRLSSESVIQKTLV